MEEGKDDKMINHAMSRAKQSKGSKPYSGPQKCRIVCDCDPWKESLESDKWTHVGVSPQISEEDKSRARSRYFATFK